MDNEKLLHGKYKNEDEHCVYPIDTINSEPDVIEGCPDAVDIIEGEMTVK